VPLAVRFERLQRRVEVVADLVEADEGVGDDARDRRGVAADVLEHRVAERVETLHLEREAGRLRVAAPAQQVRRRRGEAAHGADAGRRADAPLALGDDVDRLVVALEQLARDDAHHARVPVGIGDDDRRRARVDRRRQPLEHLVLHLLAVAVALVEERGEFHAAALGRGGEQLERQLGLAEAAGGVEPRRQHEGDVARGGRRAQARERDRGADARP
jgi:hypothetical protein